MGRTKIICTIGPAVNSLEQILELIDAGMCCARLNFSHGRHAAHAETIALIKEARELRGRPVSIMLDTKGPEIRIGEVEGDGFQVGAGQRLVVVGQAVVGNAERISVDPGHVLDTLKVGDRLLFDDGYVASQIVEKRSDGVVVEFANAGIIKSNKGVNCPDTILDLPALTDRDKEDIAFGCEQDVDWIAASFIRSADHILQIKKLLKDLDKKETLIIAKIENHEGIANFDGILQVADGIMIARGDLGVEIPLYEVPRLQKMMIRKCYLAGKPSVTATQMLESMISNPRPTRAEASDVANAIYDSTSAVMLSGETAVGKYPIETVKVMREIVEESEKDFDYRNFFDQHSRLLFNDVPSALTLAAVKTAYSSHAKAIFAFTQSGSTARQLARLRPEMPIVALAPSKKVYHQMALHWGIYSAFCAEAHTIEEAFEQASQYALSKKLVDFGDMVILTAGSPFGFSGTTNMMIVENIGDVLVRGFQGSGRRVYGKVRKVFTAEDCKPFEAKDQLLVLTQCDAHYFPLIEQSSGVILQNHIDDVASENYLLSVSRSLDLPCILRADGAVRTLTNGQLVTLDPEKALIYKGVLMECEG